MRQTIRGYVSRRMANLSREIHEPRHPRFRRLFAVLLLAFATGILYVGLTSSPLPTLIMTNSIVGVAVILMSVAYLLPRSLGKLATVLLAISRVGLWVWLAVLFMLLLWSAITWPFIGG